VIYPDDEDDPGPDDGKDPDENDCTNSVDTEPCPHCHRPIYEQAEVCPHCGNYVSTTTNSTRKPLWIVIGILIALAVVLLRWVL
jgi:predicted nucleic acid-binding Zn ribbon protein